MGSGHHPAGRRVRAAPQQQEEWRIRRHDPGECAASRQPRMSMLLSVVWALQEALKWKLHHCVARDAVCHHAEGSPPAQKFLEGKNWPAVPPFGFGVVDVDDVAAAHALAAFTPSASGRCAAWRPLLEGLQPTPGNCYTMWSSSGLMSPTEFTPASCSPVHIVRSSVQNTHDILSPGAHFQT